MIGRWPRQRSFPCVVSCNHRPEAESHLRRRDFIECIGAALACPVRARAQQADRARRIRVLLPYADNDPEAKSHISALTQELKRLGWSQDHSLRIDVRFAAGIADQ